MYTRDFLLKLRNSPLAQVPKLPVIPGVTAPREDGDDDDDVLMEGE